MRKKPPDSSVPRDYGIARMNRYGKLFHCRLQRSLTCGNRIKKLKFIAVKIIRPSYRKDIGNRFHPIRHSSGKQQLAASHYLEQILNKNRLCKLRRVNGFIIFCCRQSENDSVTPVHGIFQRFRSLKRFRNIPVAAKRLCKMCNPQIASDYK